jgi:hypothetical protein
VKTSFPPGHRTSVTAYNLSGQKIHAEPGSKEGDNEVRMDLQAYHDQVVVVKVEGNGTVTRRKVILH